MKSAVVAVAFLVCSCTTAGFRVDTKLVNLSEHEGAVLVQVEPCSRILNKESSPEQVEFCPYFQMNGTDSKAEELKARATIEARTAALKVAVCKAGSPKIVEVAKGGFSRRYLGFGVIQFPTLVDPTLYSYVCE